MMFAQVSGLEAGELIHVISDMHIYDRHVPMVTELLQREPKQAPKVIYLLGQILPPHIDVLFPFDNHKLFQ